MPTTDPSPYFIIETPFGRFMARVIDDKIESHLYDEEERINCIPIGNLEEVPAYVGSDNVFGGIWLIDNDAIDEEAKRNNPEHRGYFRPKNSYVINRATYTEEFYVSFVTYTDNAADAYRGKQTTFIRNGNTLTEAAERKLSQWFQEHREEILTQERIITAAIQTAKSNEYHDRNAVKKAQQALNEAEATLKGSSNALEYARAYYANL